MQEDTLFVESLLDNIGNEQVVQEAGTVSQVESVRVALDKILSMDPNDINMTFLQSLFAGHHDRTTNTFKDPNFKPTSKILLTPQMYKYVKEPTETTLGLLIMNRYMLERTGIIQYLGYQNNAIDDKALKKLNTAVNNLVLSDKISTDVLVEYIDSRDRLGFWCASFLSVSITPALLLPMENVKKRKAELFKERINDLNDDNPAKQIMANNEIEKELMSMVRENLKSDSGYDLYRSGDGNLDNNYKTINVMRGAVFDNAKKKYYVVDSSLMEGIKPRDITPFANSVVAAAYPSAIGTAESGYLSKQVIALLQSEHIDLDPNSDCGTQSTIPVTIQDKYKQYFVFRNFKVGNKVVGSTPDNIDQFVGKKVEMYSPQCCCHKAICAKCAGKLFHVMGNGKVRNVGMLMSQITMKMLNLKLKSKHDLTPSAGFLSLERTFLDKNNYCEITDGGDLVTKVPMKLHIPKIELDDVNAFYIESTQIQCIGIIPATFYDNHGNEVLNTIMTVPTFVELDVHNDLQENMDEYIVSYDAGSRICSVMFEQNIGAVEAYFKMIFIYSKIPLVPYNLLVDMEFRNLELNKLDLEGPSMVYELLARRLCRSGRNSFATVYGKNPNVDQKSYTKLGYREAVQQAGAVQAMFFEDISKGINVNLAMSLNGIETEDTPMEMIMRS